MKAMYIRKNRKQSSRHIWMKIFGLSVFALLVTVAWLFTNYAYRLGIRLNISPVNEVVFSGNRHLSSGELETLSGVERGEDLFSLQAKKVAEQVLASPWVKRVGVRKDFPGRLSINISEAVPLAILDMQGEMSLIDERGNILEKMTDPVAFLPVIHTGADSPDENFMEALSLAKVIKDREIAAKRSRVEILANRRGPEDMCLVVDNLLIKVGRGDYERKLSRLFAIEEEIKKKVVALDYIDLRFANRVVVKPINEVVR